MAKQTAVAKRQEQEVTVMDSTADQLLQQAIIQDLDMDKLEKFFELKRRDDADKARKAFFVAFAEFQATVPDLQKTGLVKFKTSTGIAEYPHTTLPHIAKAISDPLKQCGMSYRYTITDTDKGIAVTCTVSHVDGHSEPTSMTAQPDTSGSKNAIQAKGSTVTYLQRYTLIAALGIVTADVDNDGRGCTEVVTEQQAKDIVTLAEKQGAKFKDVLVWGGVEKVEDFPAAKYDQCMAFLNKRKAPNRNEGEAGSDEIGGGKDANGELPLD